MSDRRYIAVSITVAPILLGLLMMIGSGSGMVEVAHSSQQNTLGKINLNSPTASMSKQSSLELEPLKISPSYGFNNVPTLIYIHGNEKKQFAHPLTVTLGAVANSSQVLELTYVDAELIGALVPARLPVGMYNVTVEYAPDHSETIVDGYEVLNANVVDDLITSDEWMWSDPFPLRVDYAQSRIGLVIQHLGGDSTIDEVTVEFRQDAITGTLIGRSLTNVLVPFASESTGPVVWKPEQEGEYTICAIIDPDNEIEESNEENNTICRTLTVRPTNFDVIPPQVNENSFLIADNAVSTAEISVTLDINATDYPVTQASGLQAVQYVEFEYILGAHRWVPVQQTEWLTYTTQIYNYAWHLVPTYGVRYMQAWVADNAGNISLRPGNDMIDLLPTEQPGQVQRYGVVFYRILLEEDQNLALTLTPLQGDPDLYVWGPNGQSWYSNSYTEIESLSFQAPVRGTYQIEIHGFIDSSYRLSFDESTATQSRQWPTLNPLLHLGPKPRPTDAAASLEEWPQFYDVTAPPILQSEPIDYILYLPINIR